MGKLILNGKTYTGNSADGFPPLIYSDDEREVGVWRDGKPLYQKVITQTLTQNTSASIKSYPHNIANISEITLVLCKENRSRPTNSSTEISIAANATELAAETGQDRSSYTVTVILQYTKTTDTPGSGMWNTNGGLAHHYSTTEHIIGTWIDGKPLYEKTVEFGALPNNNQKWVAHNISNIDKITSFKSISFDGNDFIPLPYVSTDTTWECQFHVNKTSMYARTKGDKSSFAWTYVTIQYTKATD